MHNEKRQSWYKEGVYSLITGTIYGATSVIVGQPFDTIKTKMQAQKEFMGKIQMLPAMQKVWREEGLRGFYRGSLPPFFGSVAFRSLQFSCFEMVYTYLEGNPSMTKPIPNSFGLQPRVILGGLAAALVRSIIENPFEYAKVKRQTLQPWHFKDLYKGFWPLCLRTSGMMTSFFIFVDILKRNTRAYESTAGRFLMGGLAASMAWVLIWPLENVKNVVQAETKDVGKTSFDKLMYVWRNFGLMGLYRGMLPGLVGIFFRNGCSMVAMQWAIQKFTAMGLRK
jgi:solute carrier family 25 carnitine/acylcarnitine transporter 20/29